MASVSAAPPATAIAATSVAPPGQVLIRFRDFACFSRGITGCGRLFAGCYRVTPLPSRDRQGAVTAREESTDYRMVSEEGAFVKNRPLPKSFKHLQVLAQLSLKRKLCRPGTPLPAMLSSDPVPAFSRVPKYRHPPNTGSISPPPATTRSTPAMPSAPSTIDPLVLG